MSRTVPDMPSVALAVTDGMLHYELSVALEVFGADLTHVVDPWYDFSSAGAVRCPWTASAWNPTEDSTTSHTWTP